MGDSFMSLLSNEVCVRWLLTLLHFLWQGALVAGVVAIAGRLLRSASAGPRYALYSSALFILPACVLVTFCVVDVPAKSRFSSQLEGSGAIPAPSSASPLAAARAAVVPMEDAGATDTVVSNERVASMQSDTHDNPVSLSRSLLQRLPRVAPWIVSAYVAGVAAFLLRLSTAVWGGYRLRTSAARVTDAQMLKLIADQADRLKLKWVPVVAYCERVAVPTVVGVLRPIVLLPATMVTGLTIEELAAIIRHELAHVRRCDLWMNLIQRVIESLLFFHPAVWFISRRLSAEREVCCDDLVVSSGYEPMLYAGALLRMAELCAGSRRPGAAALAATGNKTSLLERRIERLMKSGATPPLQLTRAGMVSLLLILASLIIVPGIVHGWAQAQAQEFGHSAGSEPDSSDPTAPGDQANAQAPRAGARELAETTIRGVVVGPLGEPFEGALIWVSNLGHDAKHWTRKPEPKVTWTRLTESDAAGRFEATLAPTTIRQASEGRKNLLVAATAEGYGLGWGDVDMETLGEEVSLQLIEDQPIEGQIVTLEGTPAAGVSVEVSTLPWDVPNVERVAESARLSSGVYTNWPARRGGPPMTAPIVTDAEGRFRLKGMGIDRYVRMEAVGGGIGATRLKVVTHPTPKERRPGGVIAVREGRCESTYYASFIHVGTPSRTIRGTVRDAQSGKPIEGVDVTTATSWKSRAEPTVTDAKGQFELEDVPQASKYELTFDPAATHHCNKRLVLSNTAGATPLTLDIALHPGIVARGRLTDPDSGKPVQATLEYNPLFPNENWRKLGEQRVANPAATTTTDKNGAWELAVLSGPGAITATTSNTRYVEARVLRRDLEALADGVEAPGDQPELRFLQPAAGDQIRGIMGLGNAVALINPRPEAARLDVDLELVVGRGRSVTIVDESGTPVSGVQAIGLGHSAPQASANFQIKGLVPGRRRQLLFLQPERRLGAVLEVTGDELTPLTVRLRPTGALTGRFVDELGQPLPNGYVSLNVTTPDKTSLSTGLWEVLLDDDGRFRIDGVIPGCEYRVSAQVPEHRVALYVPVKAEVAPGETRDIGEFVKENSYRFKPTSTEDPGGP